MCRRSGRVGGRPSARPAVPGRRRARRNCTLPGPGKHRRMRVGRAGEHPGRHIGRGWQGGRSETSPEQAKGLGLGWGWGSRTCPVTGVSGVGLELLAETLLLHDFSVLAVKALGSTRSKSLSGKMDFFFFFKVSTKTFRVACGGAAKKMKRLKTILRKSSGNPKHLQL